MTSRADGDLGSLKVVDPRGGDHAEVDRQRRVGVDRWQVGRLHQPDRLLDIGAELEVAWFANPQHGSWVADPMPLSPTTVICEEFSHRRARGRLVEFDVSTGTLTGRRVVGGLGGHVSYPWLVEDEDGRLYVVPEQSHRNGIFAYRYGEVLGEPISLIANVHALDTTILQHQQVWYAFFSTLAGGIGGADLQIWSASRLLGPWRRVPYQPPTDAPVHRPAGTPFMMAGSLIRPSQDCTRTYGGGIRLNVIDRLDPAGYAERTAAIIVLADQRRHSGVHTISIREGLALVDAKRGVFRFDALLGRARRRAARLVRGNP